jgi:hypothetical protein
MVLTVFSGFATTFGESAAGLGGALGVDELCRDVELLFVP